MIVVCPPRPGTGFQTDPGRGGQAIRPFASARAFDLGNDHQHVTGFCAAFGPAGPYFL